MSNKLRDYIWERCQADDKATDEIISQLKSAMMECLPPMKNPNILPQQRLSTPDELIFNQAITETKARIDELFGEVGK